MSWTKVPTGCFELTKATIILWRSWLPIHLKILLWYVLWLLRCIVISILFPPLTSTPIFQLLEGQNIQVIHQYEQLGNESIQREIYIYKRRENFYLTRQQLRPSALVLLKTASFPNSNASTHHSMETPDTILTGLISDGDESTYRWDSSPSNDLVQSEQLGECTMEMNVYPVSMFIILNFSGWNSIMEVVSEGNELHLEGHHPFNNHTINPNTSQLSSGHRVLPQF